MTKKNKGKMKKIALLAMVVVLLLTAPASAAQPAKKGKVTAIRVDYVERYIGLKGGKQVHAKAVAKKGQTPVRRALRWKSSKPSLVAVGKGGWIRAKGKPGTAKITIRAHNGVKKIIKVTVGDFSHPASFEKLDQVSRWNPKAAEILRKHKADLTAVAAWLESRRANVYFCYDKGLAFEGYLNFPIQSIQKTMVRLMKTTGLRIQLMDGNVWFQLPAKGDTDFGASIIYSDYNGKDDPAIGSLKLAPCWFFQDGSAGI